MSLNVLEYGRTLRINTGLNLQGATPTLTLRSPSPVIEYKQRNTLDGVSIGTVDVDIGNGIIYKAYEYVEYKFLIGDLDASGLWAAKVEAFFTSPSQCLITDFINFEVRK